MRTLTAALLASVVIAAGCGREAVALPDFVEVVCRADGTTSLNTPSVRTQADGVHVRIVNLTSDLVTLIGLGAGAFPGASPDDLVTQAPPGSVEVACYMDDHPRSKRVGQSLTIRDVTGHWVDPEPDCPPDQGIAQGHADFAAPERELPPEPRDNALDIARRDANLRPDDIVEFAGYREAEPPTVRFVRDGLTTRTLYFTRIGGRLAPQNEKRCAD